MTFYICLDDRNGMLFNHRRQSRDAAVLADIRDSLEDVLTVEPFSESLVAQAGIPYVLAPENWEDLCPQAHFFLETGPKTAADLADRIVLYRWNRRYPGDVFWNADLTELGFSLAETSEFPGKSHEVITKEVYVR